MDRLFEGLEEFARRFPLLKLERRESAVVFVPDVGRRQPGELRAAVLRSAVSADGSGAAAAGRAVRDSLAFDDPEDGRLLSRHDDAC